MANNNYFVSNNRLCTCGEDHSSVVISLENGGHIITVPFSTKRSPCIGSIAKKKKTASTDLVSLFWSSEEQDPTESVF